jgi:hypothetical protein
MSEMIDPNQAIDYIIAKSGEYAQARAERIYMEELRKTIKAELCKTALHMALKRLTPKSVRHTPTPITKSTSWRSTSRRG